MNRRGTAVSRVLYSFRTPPDIKVGREPFDEAARRALEAQNPEVRFDWRHILETPIPSADAEKWRERRRAERSERAARQAAEREDDEASGLEEQSPQDAPMHVLEAAVSAGETVVDVLTAIEPRASSEVRLEPDATYAAPSGPRRKRRRRRGGQARPPGAPTISDTATPTVGAGEEDAADKNE